MRIPRLGQTRRMANSNGTKTTLRHRRRHPSPSLSARDICTRWRTRNPCCLGDDTDFSLILEHDCTDLLDGKAYHS